MVAATCFFVMESQSVSFTSLNVGALLTLVAAVQNFRTVLHTVHIFHSVFNHSELGHVRPSRKTGHVRPSRKTGLAARFLEPQ